MEIEFTKNNVNEMIVLMGSTVLTPSEIFIFKFPDITKNHFHENHKVQQSTLARCLSQLQEQCIKVNTSTVTRKSSNHMFVLLKSQSTDTFSFLEMENVDEIISKSNRVFYTDFHLKPKGENCCNELIVFEDLCILQEPVNNMEFECAETKAVSRVENVNKKLDWKLCKNSIRRYDCKKIQGKLIWEYKL